MNTPETAEDLFEPGQSAPAADAAAPVAQVEPVDELRSRVANLIIGLSALFGFISIPSFFRLTTQAGTPFYLAFSGPAPFLLAGAWLIRHRLSLRVRAWLLICLSVHLSLSAIVFLGREPYGYTMAVVYAALLLGRRQAWTVAGAILTLHIGVVAAIQMDIIQFSEAVMETRMSGAAQVQSVIVLWWVTALLAGIITMMHRSFLESIGLLGKRTRELETAITRRDSAEEAVRITERSYEEVFNASAEALFVLDPESLAVLAVKQDPPARMFALAPSGERTPEAAGLGIDHWVEPGQSAPALMREVIAGTPKTAQWRASKTDGTAFWAEAVLKRAQIRGITTVLGSIRDVTLRTEAKIELERYQNRLEDLVAERTAELEEAQRELVEAERLAVLGQLTATVGHEMRNPLGTIKNAVFSIGDAVQQGDEDRAERALTLVRRNVRRCDDIIHELLDYTRTPETERSLIELDPWLASIFVERADEMPQGVDIETRLDSGAEVSMYPGALYRAILNVVINAAHAIEDVADGKIVVETRTVAERVELTVRDNGPGISAEVREKILEPLFSTKAFGVGLGLPIVMKTAVEHGGGLELTSEPGNGASFTLWFPVGETPPGSAVQSLPPHS